MPTNFAAAAIPDRKEERNSKVSLTNPKASPFFSPDARAARKFLMLGR